MSSNLAPHSFVHCLRTCLTRQQIRNCSGTAAAGAEWKTCPTQRFLSEKGIRVRSSVSGYHIWVPHPAREETEWTEGLESNWGQGKVRHRNRLSIGLPQGLWAGSQGGSTSTSCLQPLRLEIYQYFSSPISQDGDLGICCGW